MAVMRRIQKGTIAIASGSASGTATITSVNTAKSVLVYSLRHNGGGGSDAPAESLVQVKLNSSTQVTATRSGSTGYDALTIYYQVIEFGHGVTVQRGTVDSTADPQTVTISAVDTSKSFALVSYYNAGSATGADDFAAIEIVSSTSISIHGTPSTGNKQFAWQVVEWDTATVQKVVHTPSTSSNSDTTTITAVSDLTETFLIDGGAVANATAGLDHVWRSRLTSTTQITNNCRLSSSIFTKKIMYVVEAPEVSVQRGTAQIDSPDSTDDNTLTAVVLAETFHLICGSGNNISTCRSTSDRYDDMLCTNILTSTTNLRLERGTTSSDETWWNWEVVSFKQGKLWIGGTSSDWDTAANWSPSGVPTSADDVILDGQALDDCDLGSNSDCKSLHSLDDWDRDFLNDSGYALNVHDGDVVLEGDNVSGSITWTNSLGTIDIKGDGDFLHYDTISAVGESDYAKIIMRGDGTYYTNDSGFDPTEGSFAYTGKRTTFTHTKFIKFDKLTINGGILDNDGTQLACWMGSATDLTVSAGSTLDGSGGIELRHNYGGTISYSALGAEATRTGYLRIYMNQGNRTGQLTGNLSNGAGLLEFRYAQDNCTFDLNDYNLTGGNITWEVNGGDTGNVFACGAGDVSVHDVTIEDEIASTGELTINLESSSWDISGSVDLDTNVAGTLALNKGTSDWTFTGADAETVNSGGFDLPDIEINKSSNGITAQDDIECGDWDQNAGAVNMAGFDLDCDDFESSTGNTRTYDGTVTVGGNVTIGNTGITFGKLVCTGTITWGDTRTIAITNYVNGDCDGASFQSATGGSQANLNLGAAKVFLSTTFTDINSTYDIDATAGSNTDGGGNSANIDFGSTGDTFAGDHAVARGIGRGIGVGIG